MPVSHADSIAPAAGDDVLDVIPLMKLDELCKHRQAMRKCVSIQLQRLRCDVCLTLCKSSAQCVICMYAWIVMHLCIHATKKAAGTQAAVLKDSQDTYSGNAYAVWLLSTAPSCVKL